MSTEVHYAPDCPLPDTLLAENAGPWRLRNLAASRLAQETADGESRLQLWVDLLLMGKAENHARLQVQLRSDAHPALEPGAAVPRSSPVLSDPSRPLAYNIVTLETAGDVAPGFWQQYLTPGHMQVAPSASPGLQSGITETVRLALGRWLADSLGVATLAGALEYVLAGPVGQFGAVQRKVLERTGQADLAVDVTPLGDLSDAEEHEGAAQTRLALFGERHGAWLLQRCVAQPQKARRNDAVPAPLYHCDVLVAESAAQLLQLAGLGRLEKRLFRAAGLLPHATLREPGSAEPTEAATPQQLDLSRVPDRSRRYLQAIVALAQQGSLDSTDLDLLLRMGRQLVRPRRRPG